MAIRAMTCLSCHFDIFHSGPELKSTTTTIHIMWETTEHSLLSGTNCVGPTAHTRHFRRKKDWNSLKKQCKSVIQVVGTKETTMKSWNSCICVAGVSCNYMYYLLFLCQIPMLAFSLWHSCTVWNDGFLLTPQGQGWIHYYERDCFWVMLEAHTKWCIRETTMHVWTHRSPIVACMQL